MEKKIIPEEKPTISTDLYSIPSVMAKIDTDFYTQKNTEPVKAAPGPTPYNKNLMTKEISKPDATSSGEEPTSCVCDQKMCIIETPRIKQPELSINKLDKVPITENEENSIVKVAEQKLYKKRQSRDMFTSSQFKKWKRSNY